MQKSMYLSILLYLPIYLYLYVDINRKKHSIMPKHYAKGGWKVSWAQRGGRMPHPSIKGLEVRVHTF